MTTAVGGGTLPACLSDKLGQGAANRQSSHILYVYKYLYSTTTIQECVCPLCCEELDLSDREFYPCKCGYQVCMWCWHRIRETESGLCPACRTPYGEDPHQFSAVDVEEVLKANKEKEAAAKRQRQQQQHPQDDGGGSGLESMDVPKDRSQLANMRVIRRNLVYAVGLPPQIALSEDQLRKSDFFGQYGKISKIVINRSQANAADVRRASASAYVTFCFKEDTLSCILALDGFYLDNRNIRASYGTSKYCSAFIKNVRCNNPDCTYLHEMGAAEDTFTKQEIQAGYVTSGRDVLARQQQIVAEQLRQAGSSGGAPRKRTGGGGPSGTGKASTTPVFPPPEFDEASKPALVPPPPPPPASMARTLSHPSSAAPVAAKHIRATSVGPSVGSGKSPTLGSMLPPGSIKAASTVGPLPVSAASVVAGVRPAKVEPPEPHTTLTPLTPLKRNKTAPKSTGELDKLVPLRSTGAKKKTGVSLAARVATSATTIGGDIIGPPLPTAAVSSLGGAPVGPGALGGRPLDGPMPASGSLLGGEIFNGPLEKKPTMVIGSGKDKWGASPQGAANGIPDMWGGGTAAPAAAANTPIGGQQIGGGPNSSSALASLLGVNLPTGSGSLHASNLWEETPAPIAAPSALSSLNGSSVPVTGGEPLVNGSSLIGGMPIGGIPIGGIPIGGSGSRMSAAPGAIAGGGKSDIALLQSLLPGVHITSGNENYGFGWNNGPGDLNGDAINHWNGGGGATSVGTIGRNNQGQSKQGIW